MRTTVQLPAELLRAAKAHAATRGETLKDFLTRAVSHELGSAMAPTTRTRVELPLVETSQPATTDVSNADIETIFVDEDAEKHGGH